MSTTVSVPLPGAAAFTGERFLPSCSGEIAYQHWHRYAFARRFVQGKRVLDAACGEGYGTALLGAVAKSVVGIDVDLATINHASATYGDGTRIQFIPTSCTGLPLPSASFDVIVSFETIEHLEPEEQPEMLAEFARVLVPDGVLVISSPNKRLYSDARAYVNPYHLRELYRDELALVLSRRFPAQQWYHQRLACWSGIWPEPAAAPADGNAPAAPGLEALVGDAQSIVPYPAPEGMYFIVVAARDAQALPAEQSNVSLFTDVDESELKRAEANAREVLRLDALLRSSDDAVTRHTHHIHHLERLVLERDRLIVERDAAIARTTDNLRQLETLLGARDDTITERERRLDEANAGLSERDLELARRAETIAGLGKRAAALETEKTRLEAELSAQQPRIAHLESFRGWLAWPWRRLRQWLAT
jgi:SAM-dependent methyltransferase